MIGRENIIKKLADKQREYEQAEAAKRKKQLQEEQDRKSKQATRDAYKSASDQTSKMNKEVWDSGKSKKSGGAGNGGCMLYILIFLAAILSIVYM